MPPSNTIRVKRLPHGLGVGIPSRMSTGASGWDLEAALETPLTLAPSQRAAVPTGFCFEIPAGLEIQVRPRSGLAFKHGVTVLNAPGTIDSDYRGEVKVILINLGSEPFLIKRGDRIAQAVPAAVCSDAGFVETSEITDTSRGEGGFGSSGV